MSIKDEVGRAKRAVDKILKSPERRARNDEIDKERRTPNGHFHIAESYFTSARKLMSHKTVGHSDHPVRLLYYTALEIYLKAFLRLKAISTGELAGRKFGPRYCCLLEKSQQFGLSVDDQDKAVLYRLSYSDERERVRYIETGAVQWIDLNTLDRTCLSLREIIFRELDAAGLPVRCLDAPPAPTDPQK
jgi:hypothetical protein